MWSATVCICEMGINGTNFGQKKVGMKETKENAKMNEEKRKKSNNLIDLNLKIQINLSRSSHYQNSCQIPGQCQQQQRQQQQDPDAQVDSQHQQIHCSPRDHRQNAVF